MRAPMCGIAAIKHAKSGHAAIVMSRPPDDNVRAHLENPAWTLR
jgi:hypothetical protein